MIGLSEPGEAKEERIKIVGMHCATCELSVTKAISSVKGAEGARVNLATGLAEIRLKGARLSEVVNAVKKAGYDVYTEQVTLRVEGSSEERNRVEEIILSLRGVVRVAVTPSLTAVVEINPLSLNPHDIVEALRSRGYRAEVVKGKNEVPELESSRRELRELVRLLVVAVAFTALTVSAQYTGEGILALLFSLPVQFYSGSRFHRGAWRSARNRTTNMDTLVSLASNVAWFYSLYDYLTGGPLLFDTTSLLITFVLTGKTIEAYMKAKASNSVVGLLSVRARKVEGDREVEVSALDLRTGDIVSVKSGDIIPADGVVEEGRGEVDESVLTGESRPVVKMKGDPVVGGSILLNGYLRVYVTRAGERTYLHQVIEGVRQAQGARLPIQRLVDRVSSIFVPLVIAVAVFTSLVWFLVLHAPVIVAVLSGVAVLAAACPCPLGLATPLAVITTVNRMAKKGIIVRDGETMEKLRGVDVVVLDKTGTLTTGDFKVVRSYGDTHALRLASALESRSSHPVAKAISSLEGDGVVKEFDEVPGEGVFGVVDGSRVIVGKRSFVTQNCSGDSPGEILVCVDSEVRSGLDLREELRPEAVEVVGQLRQRFRVIVATGDPSKSADDVGMALSVEVKKGLSPWEKVELVKSLRSEGHRIMFVGDGVNDAEVMKEADVGVALATGTEIAKYAGDIVITSIDRIPDLLAMSNRAVTKIRQNLLWAFGYNSILIPLAGGILGPLTLPPQFAALAMSMNSLAVVLWSLLT